MSIYIFESCRARMSDNEQSKQSRTKRRINANINLKKTKILKQIDVYSSFLEGKQHQFLTKPDKIKFLNEPKQTELGKQKHCVNTMHTNRCVTFDRSFDTPQSNSSALFKKNLFYRKQHIMPFRNNSVKQNRLEGQN